MSIISKALDFVGKPAKVNPMATQGHGGVPTFGGFISDVEKTPLLKGTQKYTTYSSLLVNTSIVSAGVRYFTNLVSKATWKAEPVDDTPAAREAAEFVEDVMKSTETSWTRIVRKSSLYRFYGYSILEWTAIRRADGKIGLKDIEFRAPSTIERWDIDVTGTLTGVVQRSPHTMNEIYLPRDKLVYLVDDCLSDSPEGLGLFRHLVDPAQRLARYEVLEGFGFEADLRGVPVAKAPIARMASLVEQGLMTKEQKAAAEKPLRDFITNHIKNPKLGLLLDSSPYFSLDEAGSPSGTPQWGVDILNVNTSSQEAVAAAITRLNMEIARILNVEGLLLGADSKGSYALSRDKTNALYLVVDASLNEIREGYQKDIVDRLWELNGFDPALKPKLKTEAIQFRDIEQVTAALRDMATAGATLAPNDPAINEVRDMVGLSHAPAEDDEDLSLTNSSLESDDEDAEEVDDKIKKPEDE